MLNVIQTLNLILILILTLHWTTNTIITLNLTLCCWRYHHKSNCHLRKCAVTWSLWSISFIYLILKYEIYKFHINNKKLLSLSLYNNHYLSQWSHQHYVATKLFQHVTIWFMNGKKLTLSKNCPKKLKITTSQSYPHLKIIPIMNPVL